MVLNSLLWNTMSIAWQVVPIWCPPIQCYQMEHLQILLQRPTIPWRYTAWLTQTLTTSCTLDWPFLSFSWKEHWSLMKVIGLCGWNNVQMHRSTIFNGVIYFYMPCVYAQISESLCRASKPGSYIESIPCTVFTRARLLGLAWISLDWFKKA